MIRISLHLIHIILNVFLSACLYLSWCLSFVFPVNGFHSGGSPLHHVEHSHNSLVRKSSTEPQVKLSDFILFCPWLYHWKHRCKRCGYSAVKACLFAPFEESLSLFFNVLLSQKLISDVSPPNLAQKLWNVTWSEINCASKISGVLRKLASLLSLRALNHLPPCQVFHRHDI